MPTITLQFNKGLTVDELHSLATYTHCAATIFDPYYDPSLRKKQPVKVVVTIDHQDKETIKSRICTIFPQARNPSPEEKGEFDLLIV